MPSCNGHGTLVLPVVEEPARGDVEPGLSGAIDDSSYNVVEQPVHVHGFHATLLHLLGIDHERLTYLYNGRHFRLTDVSGKVVGALVA